MDGENPKYRSKTDARSDPPQPPKLQHPRTCEGVAVLGVGADLIGRRFWTDILGFPRPYMAGPPYLLVDPCHESVPPSYKLYRLVARSVLCIVERFAQHACM